MAIRPPMLHIPPPRRRIVPPRHAPPPPERTRGAQENVMTEFEMDPTPRRGFLARLAAGSLALAAGGFTKVMAEVPSGGLESSGWDDTWMTRIKGKYRQLFDDMTVNSGFGPLMTRVWLMTSNSAYKVPEKDMSAVLVLRHEAICIAMNDTIWSKYKLGEAFNVTDPATKQPAERNIYATTKDFFMPPFATASLEALKASGVIMCACNMALSINAEKLGTKMGIEKDAAIAEWKANLVAGVTLVPSGVLAVNRAQMHGCTYCNVS
jgi:intracellular sulfur oxidation DsrE/DsrF family protein